VKSASIVLIGTAIPCLALTASAAPSFTGIGIPEGAVESVAEGVSADGSTVVGSVNHGAFEGDDEAMRWTRATGIQLLGFLGGATTGQSEARAASADGSVIVGASSGLDPDPQAFRWQNGVMEPLGTLAPGLGSLGHAVSADGSTVVGGSRSVPGSPAPNEAFRWTRSEGMAGLGFLVENPTPQTFSDAQGVSGDGSIAIGYGYSDLGLEAFRWAQATGILGLGDLPGGLYFSVASGISSDGSVVVGAGWPDTGGFEAIRWTEASGMTPLGRLPGGSNSEAIDVSADGSIVVGGGDARGSAGSIAFIWDEANGMRNLERVLVDDLGLDLSGWTLSFALGISDDGRTIVGRGTNTLGQTEGWVAVIPEPSTALLFAGGLALLAMQRRGLPPLHRRSAVVGHSHSGSGYEALSARRRGDPGR